MSYRLKELRESKGVTQLTLAKLINVSVRHYGNYESGRIDIPTGKSIILADYYDISLDYLVGRTDS
ncbi:MAG: helix-turn-helix domain-containing protein [Oscillospiraceae bacterium]|nr:helix-turn-helix domain-containing protein [Oscillospiraceae bacterium]